MYIYIYMGVCIGDHHPRDVRDRGSPAGAVEAGIIPWGCEVQPGSHPAGMSGIPEAVLRKPWDMLSRWVLGTRHKLGITRDNMLAPKGPQRGPREANGYGSMYFARVNFRRDQITCSFKGWGGLRMHFYK